MKSYFTKLLVVLIIALFTNCYNENRNQAVGNTAQDKPNVIIIYADDLGYGDLTSYNSDSKINTPHIDKLASEGMMFTDAHSSASFCTPSRYSLLTGKYSWRSENTAQLQGGYGAPIIGEDEMTLGRLFKQNGYATAAVGKWHVGMKWSLKDHELGQEEENIDFDSGLKYNPLDHGFDYYFGTSGCTTDDSPFAFIENRNVLGLPLSPGKNIQVVGDFDRETLELFYKNALVAQDWAHEKADTIFNNRALSFIKEQVNDDKPFFVYLPLSLPHIPWLPADFVRGSTGDGPRGDLVALLDYCVGQVSSTLKDLGVDENTLVIFTSDNGPREGINGHQSAGELRGYKGSIYEGGHRVPLIVKWPGKVAPNSTSNQLIGQVDLYATLASILGHSLRKNEAPDSYDFQNVLTAQSENQSVRPSYIHQYYAVRQGDWKLVVDVDNIEDVSMNTVKALELFNLREDLAETNNLIEEKPQLVETLRSLFVEVNNKGYSRPGMI